MTIQPRRFDDMMTEATRNGDYRDIALDTHNNAALSLSLDGITARVLVRKGAMFDIEAEFPRETYFNGGHWSDVDIDNALASLGITAMDLA